MMTDKEYLIRLKLEKKRIKRFQFRADEKIVAQIPKDSKGGSIYPLDKDGNRLTEKPVAWVNYHIFRNAIRPTYDQMMQATINFEYVDIHNDVVTIFKSVKFKNRCKKYWR